MFGVLLRSTLLLSHNHCFIVVFLYYVGGWWTLATLTCFRVKIRRSNCIMGGIIMPIIWMKTTIFTNTLLHYFSLVCWLNHDRLGIGVSVGIIKLNLFKKHCWVKGTTVIKLLSFPFVLITWLFLTIIWIRLLVIKLISFSLFAVWLIWC